MFLQKCVPRTRTQTGFLVEDNSYGHEYVFLGRSVYVRVPLRTLLVFRKFAAEQMRETLQVHLNSMPTALDLATLEYLATR